MPDYISEDQGSNTIELSRSELLDTNKNQHTSSAVDRLFEAAYENPVKTGLAIGAVAAAGALAYASRGRILEKMPWSKPSVLVIEDTPAMGMAIRDVLKAEGHSVTWVTNVKSLKPLIGTTVEGAEINLARQRFKLALVDGDLGKGVLTGPEIVGTLKGHNIMSIGTSTVESFNIDMLTNGASLAANKAVLFTSLVGKRLDLKAALKAPGAAQQGLDDFAKLIRSPENSQLRKQADEALMRYLSGKKG